LPVFDLKQGRRSCAFHDGMPLMASRMEVAMAKAKDWNWERPVNVVAAGWALSVTLVALFVVCVLAALLFPGTPLAHSWVRLFTVAPMESGRLWVEGVIANVTFAWFTAIVLGLTYNRLAR
jgi:hypothetical protein